MCRPYAARDKRILTLFEKNPCFLAFASALLLAFGSGAQSNWISFNLGVVIVGNAEVSEFPLELHELVVHFVPFQFFLVLLVLMVGMSCFIALRIVCTGRLKCIIGLCSSKDLCSITNKASKPSCQMWALALFDSKRVVPRVLVYMVGVMWALRFLLVFSFSGWSKLFSAKKLERIFSA